MLYIDQNKYILLCISGIDIHIITLVLIMLICGCFGGYLNYLHKFDTTDSDKNNTAAKNKYILLGVGASFIVPLLLNMIQSSLIDEENFVNRNYLIFAGFCLITAIFSRRFITSIGEKILEKAENAEKAAKENKQLIENTKLELSSTQERIEDVKSAITLKNTDSKIVSSEDKNQQELLLELVNSYIEKTSVPDYTERLKLKAELGRKMGSIIARYNLPKDKFLKDYPMEGMYLALAYSVELSPDAEGMSILNQLSKIVSQLYTKYVILLAYKTLANSGIIKKDQAKNVADLILKFKDKADKPLLRNINDTISVLKFIDPNI